MVGARTPRLILSALAIASTALMGAFAGGASPAAAASPHHAAVIVDTGAGVHKVVVTFDEDSISGIDALQRAGANPVIYNFGGQGGAVCRIFGVGRDSGPNCLGGQDGDNRYWAYFRAPAGSSSFTYSSIGAGSTRVHDGDVEGWNFGTGAAPAFVSLQSLLPPPATNPPATTPATNAPSTGDAGATPGTPPNDPVGGQESASPSSNGTLPVTGAATSANGTTTTDANGVASGTASGKHNTDTKRADGDAKEQTVKTALASSDADGGGGSSASSLVWFALLLAVIVATIFVVRRVRRRTT